jgi:Zn-dependent protease
MLARVLRLGSEYTALDRGRIAPFDRLQGTPVNGSLKLGSVFGITIRVHFLLIVLLGLLVMQAHDALLAALLLVMGFGIVLLHELAHSLVAMRFGLRVVDITLWPLGGMARMSTMPESSRIEGLIAVAGPLLNFVLAGLSLPVWLWAATSDPARPLLQIVAGQFLLWNLSLGGFNLLPAFPMDGGRILRSFLGRKGNWVLATLRAVRVGRAVALLLALFGVLTIPWLGMQSILFIFIALFVGWAGTQELSAVRARHGEDPLAAFREFAARATGWSQTQPASEFARAPQPQPPPPLSGDRGEDAAGFSEKEVERLERYRGPLRSYRPEES